MTARVEHARTRRRGLGDAMRDLEGALTAPSSAEGWTDNVARHVAVLRQALADHIEVTEGSGGLLEEIVDTEPRLEGEARLIRSEHDVLNNSIDKVEDMLGAKGEADEIRRQSMVVLGRLALHRQRGADLVYEAYNVDIATAD